MSVFISPHSDDECLFGAFTILREQPLVVIVYDGHVQAQRGLPVTWRQRREETVRALDILGSGLVVKFLGFSDADETVNAEDIRQEIAYLTVGEDRIYAPAIESGGHKQHNLVAWAVPNGQNVTRYLTYTQYGKSRDGREVAIESPDWIALKLEALACYRSQFSLDPRMGCWPHFLRSQMEYYAI